MSSMIRCQLCGDVVEWDISVTILFQEKGVSHPSHIRMVCRQCYLDILQEMERSMIP